jgi:hypothetical protein
MHDGVCLSDYWYLVSGDNAEAPPLPPEQFREAIEPVGDSFVEHLVQRCAVLHQLGARVRLASEVEAAIVFSTLPPASAKRVWALFARSGARRRLAEQLQNLPTIPREIVVWAWRSFCDRLAAEPGSILQTVQEQPAALARHLKSMLGVTQKKA